MEALPGLWSLSPIGLALGIIATLYWALVTGRLITKSSHEREIGIYQGIIEKQSDTIKEQGTQITSLLSVGSTVQAVLRAAGPSVDEDTIPGGDR